MYNVVTDLPAGAPRAGRGPRSVRRRGEPHRGLERRILTFFDASCRRKEKGVPFARLCERIVARCRSMSMSSFDIDGLDPALCPHTGTPVPGGLSFAEATGILRAVVASGRCIVGCD